MRKSKILYVEEYYLNEIKCPSCGKIIQIDEKDYDSIVKQICNHEFEEEKYY